jgi:DNA-binding LacI/PurR family transcriptional regulator
MRDAGLRPRIPQQEDRLDLADARGWCRELLSGRDAPTAVTGYSPSDLGIVLVGAELMGLRVPEDLSLAGISEAPKMVGDRWLKVFRIPHREVGRSAVEMLMEMVSDPSTPIASRPVPPGEELRGDTCGPAPRDKTN